MSTPEDSHPPDFRDRILAATVHLCGLVALWLPGLGLWMLTKDDNPWLKNHGRSAALFQFLMFGCFLIFATCFKVSGISLGSPHSPWKALANFNVAAKTRPIMFTLWLIGILCFGASYVVWLVFSVASALAAWSSRPPVYPQPNIR